MTALNLQGHLPRRGLLLGLGAIATLGPTRLALARAPGDARLVVVLLRGALDGLAAVPPYGDPDFAQLRPGEPREPGVAGGPLDLGGRFGLHPRLTNIHAMFQANEALVVHAIAGAYRTRSHFDAQALLESGEARIGTSGWLNRALAGLPEPAQGARNGLALGTDIPLLLRGPVRIANHAPLTAARPEDDLMARIAALNAPDPLLGPAMREGLAQRAFTASALGPQPQGTPAGGPRPPNPTAELARTAGRLLAEANGPRVAALDMGGWDTHVGQAQRLPNTLGALDEALGALRDALGPVWRRTAVLVMTEFGRTAAINGNGGTDHGTGGAAFLLGGAVAGGRVIADWPGLAPERLFERRDLAPTEDLRSLILPLLREHLRLPERTVAAAFPGTGGLSTMRGLLRG